MEFQCNCVNIMPCLEWECTTWLNGAIWYCKLLIISKLKNPKQSNPCMRVFFRAQRDTLSLLNQPKLWKEWETRSCEDMLDLWNKKIMSIGHS